MSRHRWRAWVALVVVATASLAYGESGAEGWLRYAPLSNGVAASYVTLPGQIVVLSDTPTDQAAAKELQRGLGSMLGRAFTVSHELPEGGDAIVLANLATLSRAFGLAGDKLPPESFTLGEKTEGKTHRYIILGADPRGELYGVFHLLALVGAEKPLPAKPAAESPSSPIRWVNQWDNLDGSIERGYAGRSIFFDNGHVRTDLTRVSDYGRLLASVGINGVTVNNVNSDLRTLEPGMIVEFARIADQLRPWGVRMSLSVDLSSPQVVGHLATFDPVDPTVIAWWKAKVDEIYKAIPDFGGFVIKADSEGRLGPSKYGRTPAEAANAVARALKPHGGVVLYRGFVYNNHLDYNDLKADRARAGYDNFHALDGKFESNVVIQVKNGPIDFQIREPASPLFAALQHTSQAIELQITQEYLGQQRHMVFLVPMWKTTLDTDLARRQPKHACQRDRRRQIASISHSADLWAWPTSASMPTGCITPWPWPISTASAGSPGTPTSPPTRSSTRGPGSRGGITLLLSPLSMSFSATPGTSTSSTPATSASAPSPTSSAIHYGPGIESAERNGWGQWFRADATASAWTAP